MEETMEVRGLLQQACVIVRGENIVAYGTCLQLESILSCCRLCASVLSLAPRFVTN